MNLTSRHFVLLLFPLLAACAHQPQQVVADAPVLSANPVKPPLEKIIEPPKLDLPNMALTDKMLYEFLLGDIAAQRGRPELAAQAYLDLAKATRDPRVAKRAAQLAFEAHQYEQSVEAFGLWQQLESSSPLARQMLVSLLLSGGKLQEALPHANTMLQAEPDNVGRTLMSLYGLLGRVQDKRAALDWFSQVAQPYPNAAEAHWATAQLAAATGNRELAQSEAHQALLLRPDWDIAVMLEAQLLRDAEPQKSILLLKNYLDKFDESKEVRLVYARLLLEQQRYAEARDEFGKLLKQRPDSHELAFAIALISLQLGELDRAETELRQALASDDKNKNENTLHYYLAQLCEAKKDESCALQHYRQVSGGDHLYPAHLRLAYLLNKSGQLDEARQVLKQATPKDKAQRVQLIMLESQFLRDAKRLDESFKVLQSGLEALPNQPELLYQSAIIADKLNKPELFEQLARKLIKIEPENAHSYNALGYSFLERNVRIPEAMELVEKAYQLAPDDAAIMDSMGWGYFRLGQYEKSLSFLQRAYKTNPDPEIASHLGEVLWKMGDQDGARKVWTDSAKANPDNDALKAVMQRFIP